MRRLLNIALVLEERYRTAMEQLIAQIGCCQPKRRTLEYPDASYPAWCWFFDPFEDEDYDKILHFIQYKKHAMITIFEDGEMTRYFEPSDRYGTDEIFESILSWETEIKFPDEEAPYVRDESGTGLSIYRLASILKKYVVNDLEATDTKYVYETLRDVCGCSDAEIRDLGFGDLIPED